MDGNVIDIFGDINQDGTGQPWEYVDGWAYRNSLGPSETFNTSNWVFSGVNALDGEFTNSGASIPFPKGTYGSSTLSVFKNQIENFKMYPNPVVNGYLFFSSRNNMNKQIQIYLLSGQQVYSKNLELEEKLDVSNLNKGIYLIRIEEESKITTRKLIVN